MSVDDSVNRIREILEGMGEWAARGGRSRGEVLVLEVPGDAEHAGVERA